MAIDRDPQSITGRYSSAMWKLLAISSATILWPVLALGASAAGSLTTPQFAKLPASSYSTASVDWAVADFNGDSIPDLVSTEIGGRLDRNTLYRVKLQLSGAEGSAFDIRLSERRGLNITARDIDGDHDLDLVITSGIFRQPVGIWLNDGKGSFTQTDASAYSGNIWQEPPVLVQNGVVQQSLSALLVQARYSFPTPQSFRFEVPSGKTGPPRRGSVQAPCRFICCQLHVRPPPPSETIPAM